MTVLHVQYMCARLYSTGRYIHSTYVRIHMQIRYYCVIRVGRSLMLCLSIASRKITQEGTIFHAVFSLVSFSARFMVRKINLRIKIIPK